MKAVLRTEHLKRLIKSTAKFISKNADRPMLQYIKLQFDSVTNSVKAFGVDGYRLSVEDAPCLEVDESFTVYIKPYLPVVAKEPYAKIELVNDRCLIEIGGRIVGLVQPKGEYLDCEKVISGAEQEAVAFKICVNEKYLSEALNSISQDIGKHVTIEMRSKTTPIIIKSQYGTRLVLPCRSVTDE